MRDVAPTGAICCLAVHLHGDWNTRPKKVWTAGLTVEDASHLLFPPTFEWSSDNKGLSAARKGGKRESDAWMMRWCVLTRHQENEPHHKSSGHKKAPLLLFTPSHPTPQLSPWRRRGDCFNIWAYSLHSLIWHTQKTYSAPIPLPEVLDILRKWQDADAVKHSSWAFACLTFLHKQFRLYVIYKADERRKRITNGIKINMLYSISLLYNHWWHFEKIWLSI